MIFFFVLGHELSHSIVAKWNGVEVKRIILTFIGGIATVDVPENPRLEFWMALAGPAFNGVVAILSFLLLLFIAPSSVDYLSVFEENPQLNLTYLLFNVIYINFMLGIFNLLPGFPMDGGRILRSFLAMHMDYLKATRIAVGVSQYLIFPLLFVLGLFMAHPILIFISIILYLAGLGELQLVEQRHKLRRLKLAELPLRGFRHVHKDLPLGDFLTHVFEPGWREYLVCDTDGRVYGVFDIDTLKNIDMKNLSPHKPIENFISDNFQVADVNQSAEKLVQKLHSGDKVIVIKDGRIVALTTPKEIEEASELYLLRKKLQDFKVH